MYRKFLRLLKESIKFLACNFDLARVSSQLPEQKECLLMVFFILFRVWLPFNAEAFIFMVCAGRHWSL